MPLLCISERELVYNKRVLLTNPLKDDALGKCPF